MSELDPTIVGAVGTAVVAMAGAVIKALRDLGKSQAEIAELQREKTQLEERLLEVERGLASQVTAGQFAQFSRTVTEMIDRQTERLRKLKSLAEESTGKR